MHPGASWSGQSMAEFWLSLFFLCFITCFVCCFGFGVCFFSWFLTLCFARKLQNPGNESKAPRAPFYPPQPRSIQASRPS